VGIGFSFGDPPPVAKALVEFAKVNDALQIKGGVLDGAILDEQAIKNLADLPPLEVLRAQLLGVISAPATQLAGVVASGVRQVVNVVKAYADTAEEEAAAA
jgi:large subunit ribosomal protein L10